MRPLARVLVASVGLFLSAAQPMAAPTVQVLGVRRMQPGWVRAYWKATGAPKGAEYELSFACGAPTDIKSIAGAQTTGSVLGIDIIVNAAWLERNGYPGPAASRISRSPCR
jgi:hypothetical protein